MTGEFESSEYPNVSERCAVLGIDPPTGLAILPTNIDSAAAAADLVYAMETSTILKLWRQAGLEGEHAPLTSERRYQVLHFADWVGPTLFVAASLLSGNERAVEVALGVIANYVTETFRGVGGSKTARLDVIVETDSGTTKKVRYEGPAEGLAKLPAVIREVAGRADEEGG
jgi:hypothetical protein